MKKIVLCGISALSLLLTACVTFPVDDIKIYAESDPKANFSGYKSYAWLGTAGAFKDTEGKWKSGSLDVDAELTYLINRELRERNIKELNLNSDLLISYILKINMDALKNKINPKSKISTLENVPKGSLVLVLIDSQTGFIVWAASAKAEIKNLTPELAKQRLDYTITQMIKKIPR